MERLDTARMTLLHHAVRNRTASGVTQDRYQPGSEFEDREFDAADLGVASDVSGHPNHKEIAESLIEEQLNRNPRIGTTQDDGKGLLAGCKLGVPFGVQEHFGAALVSDEAAVVLPKSFKGFERRRGTPSSIWGHPDPSTINRPWGRPDRRVRPPPLSSSCESVPSG
jgi:hypothetical protein